MPASSPIARRSRAVASAALAACVIVLVAACSTADEPIAEGPPSLPDLTPEAGTVRTTVEAPVAGIGTGTGTGTGGASAPATDGPGDDTGGEDTGGDDTGGDDTGGDPDGHPAGLGRVLLVGDSVLVLVVDELAVRLRATLAVDGADCRRLDLPVSGPCGGVPAGADVASGLDAIRSALTATSEPPDAAVFVLANNAALARADLDAAMAATAGIDHVWWVNARIEGLGRQDANNRVLAELAAEDPRAGVIDWHAASEGRGWLSDSVHPGPEGQAELAALIEDRLRCRCTG